MKLDPSIQVSSVPERFGYGVAPGFLRGSMQPCGSAGVVVVQEMIDSAAQRAAVDKQNTKLSQHDVSVVSHLKGTALANMAVDRAENLAAVERQDAALERAAQECLPINSNGVIDEWSIGDSLHGPFSPGEALGSEALTA
jgi:hypothetical protein